MALLCPDCNARAGIGAKQRCKAALDIAPQPKTGEAARLGEDVLQAYSAVVFDFNAMTFSVRK